MVSATIINPTVSHERKIFMRGNFNVRRRALAMHKTTFFMDETIICKNALRLKKKKGE